MPRARQTESKIIRHTNAAGQAVVYHYDRQSGARLAEEPAKPAPQPPQRADSLAFQHAVMLTNRAPGAITLGELFRAWRYSLEFAELAAKTQRNYSAVGNHKALAPLLAVPCAAITPRALRMLRDGIAEAGRARPASRRALACGEAPPGPARDMANLALSVLNVGFGWGVENLDLPHNPAAGIKKLRLTTKGHLPWSDEAVAAWLARAPVWATKLVRLGLWTALRAQDLISLRWDAWDGAGIQITPSKTKRSSGAALYIPLSPEANATLAAWRAEKTVGLTILTEPRGRPWCDTNYLAKAMGRCRATHGLTGTTHGLRVTAATRLIEAGVAARDVMALTGHTQDASFAKYIRHADQRQRAERAAATWARVTPLRQAGA